MDSPIVSVVVITYNSSKYILECLDSIYNQTYENVELIISDDCSKDETVEICREWLSEKGERFVKTELIAVEKNTGTSANCNRGIRASSGEWVKLIAGDDCLLPNCIYDYVEYANENSEANIIFSKLKPIGDVVKGEEKMCFNIEPLFSRLSSRQIQILLCLRNFLQAPSMIMRKKAWCKLGGYDEDIPLIEDWPMWMKATQTGYVLKFMNKTTVAYRFSDNSISQGNKKDAYLESENKAAEKGRNYLKNMNVGARFLCYTLLRSTNNKLFRLIHLLNVFNPFYFEYMNAIKMFDIVYNDIKENKVEFSSL